MPEALIGLFNSTAGNLGKVIVKAYPDWNLQPRQIFPIYLGVFPFNWWSDFFFHLHFHFHFDLFSFHFFFLFYWILENNKEITQWPTLKLPMILIDCLVLLHIPIYIMSWFKCFVPDQKNDSKFSFCVYFWSGPKKLNQDVLELVEW